MTPLDIALSHIGRGWNPVPVAHRSKKPSAGEGWQHIRINADNATQYFNGVQQNIGIQMGPASKGLTDCDLDNEEARAIAPYFMPRTKSKFGRASARWSHYLYNSNLADITGAASIAFKDPITHEMILELRVGGGNKGAQTVGPGSTHEETGELVQWEENGEPTRVSGEDLLNRAKIVASLASLVRRWPQPGSKARHVTALRLGGFLARCNWNEVRIGLALEAVARAANDEEAQDRKTAGRDALRYFLNGGNTAGFPTLCEDFGEPIAKRVAEWLGYKPEANDYDRHSHRHQSKKADTPPAAALELVDATDVKMSAVQWLWRGRFAVGKLSLLAGLPDQGKSQIACDITARVTTPKADDKRWPCGEGAAPIGNVIILSAEDDPADTLVPRLLAAGADLARVKFVKMVKTESGSRRMFDLAADLDQLRQAMVAVGDVRLIVFDPLNAYFGNGKIDIFRGNDVRAVLGPLSDLAADLKVAILGLVHFNKKSDVTNVMLRVSDSLSFVAAARAVYAVIPDDENQRSLMVRGKNNLAPSTADKTLAYGFNVATVGKDPETDQEITAPHIFWFDKHVEVSASEAMQAAAENRSPGQLESAISFLNDLLAEGAVEHADVQERAEVYKISDATLRRASGKLKIEKSKQPRIKDGPWYWRLPNRGHRWPWEVAKPADEAFIPL
jgi:hypothetical protein